MWIILYTFFGPNILCLAKKAFSIFYFQRSYKNIVLQKERNFYETPTSYYSLHLIILKIDFKATTVTY